MFKRASQAEAEKTSNQYVFIQGVPAVNVHAWPAYDDKSHKRHGNVNVPGVFMNKEPKFMHEEPFVGKYHSRAEESIGDG